jgi:hypothetical protein
VGTLAAGGQLRALRRQPAPAPQAPGGLRLLLLLPRLLLMAGLTVGAAQQGRFPGLAGNLE